MKIYIAKSNKANPEYLIKVRDFLSKFKTVEILEYSGGKYTNDDLIESDLLVVIPDLSETINDNRITLGKGLYMQIDDYILNQSIDNIFIVTGVNNKGEIEYSDINEVDSYDNYDDTCIEIINENDYIKYGRIKVCEEKRVLTNILAELILINEADINDYTEQEGEVLWRKYVLEEDSSTSNKYKYLLIKN